ncbi:MAG: class I SAM-dependent methyltransferase [Candidatus Thiodiazotropha taylori]|nr:class I SAM-dependent methyltransferase [Candidatus Thiodiazotropha taylori]MCW4226719.1 class I SAM-dependent methyltransferase [Candidatus Thiodiazotropha endolucinida]MCG7888281.1 class I SAM-dependent methyltransferase [Candidatus Thiodiazotropha taylori]MCG7949889.1 class I SAM-dependent methyltransferase [Candidatus Thiodiazotropha taylori]MCG8031759.1 class I SAM-dependent methyltransferase [Candidatus Thiodiazotropha taylori]
MTEQMLKYHSLQTQLDLHQGVPYSPNWSAEADFIQLIVDACLKLRPRQILECGSGLTTLMLARCCQINGEGRVISLEDGLQYVDNTRAYIDRYGLGSHATVVHAPLQDRVVDGALYSWYATDAIPETGIDMLVIDGPSGFIQKHSRYPVLPVCYPRLADHCAIYLDDAAREDEQAIVAMWQSRFPDLKHEFHATSRGCSVLFI